MIEKKIKEKKKRQEKRRKCKLGEYNKTLNMPVLAYAQCILVHISIDDKDL